MAVTPLLAFGFGSAAMLWGLGLASAPIVIHLLSRRRYRELEWAAMQWLLAAIKKHARRIQLEQIILLAVRTALVLCVILAMARPFLHRAGVPLLPGTRTHRVLVIDASFSMGYQLIDRTRFDRAKEVALAILEGAHQGDVASLILLAAPPRAIVGDASANFDAVAGEVQALELLHGTADLPASLSMLQEILSASTFDQKEVYFITDLQRATWADVTGTDAARFHELAARVAEQASLVVIDLGQGSTNNISVVSFDGQTPFVTVGEQTTFAVTVRNFGQSNSNALPVTLLVDGEPQNRRTIDLPAGQKVDLLLTHSFVTPGAHLVEIAMEGDSLPIDDHRWLSVEVKEYVELLLVDGEPSGSPFGAETDYLRVALDPAPGSTSDQSAVRPEVVHESDFGQVELGRFDCVILANVGQFTKEEARLLDRYVHGGGSLIWFLGDQVDMQSYNELLFKEARGILPVRLGSIVGNARVRQNVFHLDPLEYNHPIVQPFRGVSHGGLLTTKIFQYVRVELPPESPARVALAYEGGDPAIITGEAGRGRVAVVTTSADIEWTNWPYWYSYVPLVNELVAYAVADRDKSRNVQVGQSLTQTVPPTAVDVPVTVDLPDGKSVLSRVAPGEEPRDFPFDQTLQSGGYWVRLGPPLATEALFAVNFDWRESDLTRLPPEELKGLLPAGRYRYLTNWQAITTGRSSVTATRGKLHPYLLYGALVLLFTESLLAWKFGHYAS